MRSDTRRYGKTHGKLLILLLIGLMQVTSVQATSLDTQRTWFVKAEKALKSGNRQEYRQLKEKLQAYPLLPYLEYQELRWSLNDSSAKQVRDFLQRYSDTPLAGRMRGAWLRHLAKGKRWNEFLDFFEPSKSTRMRCNHLNALIHTGRADIAFPQVKQLWLVGRSQTGECDPVFDAWRKAGHLTKELVWQRIRLAMNKGQPKLVHYLKRYLPANERSWAELWIKVRSKPQLITEHELFREPHPQRNAILLYGLARLARVGTDPVTRAWDRLSERYTFNSEEMRRGEHAVAGAYIRHDHPQVLTYLEQVEPGDDLNLHQKRILVALENQDWQKALFWINALPKDERGIERWLYWKGRVLQKLGRKDEARIQLAQVAGDRTYYAFLAADRIGADYYLKHSALQVQAGLVQALEQQPGAQRTRELLALERYTDARREWRWLTRDMAKDAFKVAAILAESWGWLNQAIFTLARSGYWDDLEFRFPVEHLDLVKHHAAQHGIQVPWVLAVMRQESAFSPRALSHAGARGLMQLMPATARSVAKRLGKPRPRERDLFKPETNIPLGTAYLSQVYKQLYQNPVLATAAYNAGPHRVNRWLPEQTLDADIWVETIPFKETRNYVKRVMAYGLIYEKRLGLKPGSIINRMRPIQGTLGKQTAVNNPQADGSRG